MDRIIDQADFADQLEMALADVRAGRSVTITSKGAPLAKLVPSPRTETNEDEARARERRVEAALRMVEEARKRGPIIVGPWTREELYERTPWPDGPPCP